MGTSDEDKTREEAEERDEAGERDESGGDDGGEGEPEEKAPAKPAAKPAEDRTYAKPVALPSPPPSAGLGKSVSLFVLVVGGLSLAMFALGNERGGAGGAQAPKWNEGQTVDVDITLVSTDRTDLACASGTEIKGLHCAYESQSKRWSKTDANDEKKTLRPYSTTTSVNMLAAGVWSEPVLAADKMPGTRFTLKCKFNVAGKMPRADVRWHEGEGWNNVTDWYTGTVSDCKMGPIQN